MCLSARTNPFSLSFCWPVLLVLHQAPKPSSSQNSYLGSLLKLLLAHRGLQLKERLNLRKQKFNPNIYFPGVKGYFWPIFICSWWWQLSTFSFNTLTILFTLITSAVSGWDSPPGECREGGRPGSGGASSKLHHFCICSQLHHFCICSKLHHFCICSKRHHFCICS